MIRVFVLFQTILASSGSFPFIILSDKGQTRGDQNEDKIKLMAFVPIIWGSLKGLNKQGDNAYTYLPADSLLSGRIPLWKEEKKNICF